MGIKKIKLYFSSFFLFILSASSLWGSNYSIDFFHNKPWGVARDFYIWQFLDQKNLTEPEINIAEKLISNMNDKLLFRLGSKSNNPLIKYESYCKRVSTMKLIRMQPRCVDIGLTTYEAINLKKADLEFLIDRMSMDYPDRIEVFDIFLSGDIFHKTINSEPKIFFEIFNNIGNKYRTKFFDRIIPTEYIQELTGHEAFEKMIFHIVTSFAFKKLPKSFLYIDAQKLSFQSTFFLALNAIKLNNLNVALNYLKDSEKKAKYREEKDRVIFWKYLITKQDKYLKLLSESFDINIYTIYAMQKLSKKHKNIITSIKVNNKKDGFDIKDPFAWERVKQDIKFLSPKALKRYAKKFHSTKTIPHKAYILQKSNYKKHYFITPYQEHTAIKDIDTLALFYAIAKQESGFIPVAISKSYAIGFMQFMPFLIDEMSKIMELDNLKYQDMFDPKISTLFAILHISYLKKYLEHPLLIAYAYNRGIGYTQRLVKTEAFKQKAFEPYLSMELVPSAEATTYGKKVMANYIIYLDLFGKEEKLDLLLKKIIK